MHKLYTEQFFCCKPQEPELLWHHTCETNYRLKLLFHQDLSPVLDVDALLCRLALYSAALEVEDVEWHLGLVEGDRLYRAAAAIENSVIDSLFAYYSKIQECFSIGMFVEIVKKVRRSPDGWHHAVIKPHG